MAVVCFLSYMAIYLQVENTLHLSCVVLRFYYTCLSRVKIKTLITLFLRAKLHEKAQRFELGAVTASVPGLIVT